MEIIVWIELGITSLLFVLYCWVVRSESILIAYSELNQTSLGHSSSELFSFDKHSSVKLNETLSVLMMLRYFSLIGFVSLSLLVSVNLTNSLVDKPIAGLLFYISFGILSVLFISQQILRKSKNQYNEERIDKRIKFLSFLNKIPVFNIPSKGLRKFADYRISKTLKINSENSFDDIEQAIAQSKEDGKTDDQKILEGIVKYGNTEACQIMTSRMDVVSINENLTYFQVLEQIKEHGYSRIPIFKDHFDKIIGILYIKDLLPHIDKADNFNWQKLLRKPLFVPERKKIDDLLQEFQLKKMHLAILIDEYGGASGILTLEDILEEIVGDITDEYDDEIVINRIDENTVIFEGRTPLYDFYSALNIDGKNFDLTKGSSDTLGGFIIEKAGKILKNDEFIIFDNIKLIVESSDKKRIKSIKSIVLKTNSSE